MARATGDRAAEAKALNALGTALGGRGDAEEGVRLLRESLAIAHELGLGMEEGGAWINIADVLHLAGRTEEALQVVRDGIDAGSAGSGRTIDWLWLAVAEFSFHLGDWDAAEEAIPPPSRRHTGGTFLLWQLCRARLALGRGDLELAEDALSALDRAPRARPSRSSSGPTASCARAGAPGRRRPAARAAVDDALDRIEYCSDDMARITAWPPPGCAWRATRDSWPATAGTPRPSSRARERADTLLERTRLAAASGGPVEEAELALAEAEYGRATGANGAAQWAAAAALGARSERRTRRLRALARGRGADGGPRPRRATRAASAALDGARRLGSAWLVEEVESLAARARLQLGESATASAAGGRGARGSVRPHGPRARRARAGGRGRDQPRDRRAAPHGGEDGERARLPHPREAERALAHRGGRGCAQAGPGGSRRSA